MILEFNNLVFNANIIGYSQKKEFENRMNSNIYNILYFLPL